MYLDFAPAIEHKRDIADFVATHPGTSQSSGVYAHPSCLVAGIRDKLRSNRSCQAGLRR
jgi:hypothetical protein